MSAPLKALLARALYTAQDEPGAPGKGSISSVGAGELRPLVILTVWASGIQLRLRTRNVAVAKGVRLERAPEEICGLRKVRYATKGPMTSWAKCLRQNPHDVCLSRR